MKNIILASASPRRAELLRQICIEFTIMPSDFNEDMSVNKIPEEVAEELAYCKALNVAMNTVRPSIVLGADTIVVKDGILGKPRDADEAFAMLKKLQNSWHEVITGVALVEQGSLRTLKGHEKTRVKMRSLDEYKIRSYISSGEPMDKAGAYGIQGMGAVLVERIEGCYSNVVGLPLSRLSLMLENFGVNVL